MDLSMPGMNGIEAMIDIKRRQPETRVLVLTIHKTEEYIHASLRAGAPAPMATFSRTRPTRSCTSRSAAC